MITLELTDEEAVLLGGVLALHSRIPEAPDAVVDLMMKLAHAREAAREAAEVKREKLENEKHHDHERIRR